MSGRHKFSEIEATMTPQRRARIDRLAQKLQGEIDSASRRVLPKDGESTKRAGRKPKSGRILPEKMV